MFWSNPSDSRWSRWRKTAAKAREVGLPNLWFLEYCIFTMSLVIQDHQNVLVVQEDKCTRGQDNVENINGQSVSTLQLELLDSSVLNRVSAYSVSTFKRHLTESTLQQGPNISSTEKIKKLSSPLLRSMCVDRGELVQSSVMKANLIYFIGSDVKIYICYQTGERLNPECVK